MKTRLKIYISFYHQSAIQREIAPERIIIREEYFTLAGEPNVWTWPEIKELTIKPIEEHHDPSN